jgi:hypothetical protein
MTRSNFARTVAVAFAMVCSVALAHTQDGSLGDSADCMTADTGGGLHTGTTIVFRQNQ